LTGIASVTDARGGKVAFTYGSFNRLATRTDVVNAVAKVTTRDGVGNVLTASDRKAQVVTSTYDQLGIPQASKPAPRVAMCSFTMHAGE